MPSAGLVLTGGGASGISRCEFPYRCDPSGDSQVTFTTLTFVCFCIVVFAAYWMLGQRFRWQNLLLVAASYFFYSWWDWRFCALMLASSLVDYGAGCGMRYWQRPATRRLLLAVSLVSNLGLLGFFKYFNFFAANLEAAASSAGWHFHPVTLQIILPVGISFYTFQTMSYTIDVYRGKLKPTYNLIDYLAFVSFFPQLVAGPIERATNLLPQFSAPRRFDSALAGGACKLVLWGVFKKLVIADRLAAIVDARFAEPESYNGAALALATVCFAFQIYCDFSAYSDIATGVARMFGIQLMRNFAYPYFSQSVGEFWRRWHISLSSWFRDYVYIPLGGKRTSRLRAVLNLMLTFLISGLWHGAAWRFLTWGGINGAVASVNKGGKNSASDTPGGEHLIPRPFTLLKIMLTFCCICVCWVFFRAGNFSQACDILATVVSDCFSLTVFTDMVNGSLDITREMQTTLWALAVFTAWEWIQRRKICPLEMSGPAPVRWVVYSAVIWSTLYLMPATGGQEFVYFTF